MKINLTFFAISAIIVFSAIVVSVSAGLFSNVMLYGLDNDNDNIYDDIDNCPTVQNTDQADFDNDLIGDTCDTDDDNDGFTDALDVFDFDPTEWSDFDFDGIGSMNDTDDDNDGILDSDDAHPTLKSESLGVKYVQNIQNCAVIVDGSSRLLCYSQFFEKVAENEENNSDALELSIALSKLKVIDDCHFVAHQVGHVAFTKNSDVIKNLEGMDGTMCRGGYFHGVLASYFHNIEESGESFPSAYNRICDDLIGSSNYQDCIHGLGHGFVHYFDEDLNSSLELCHSMSFYQDRLCVKGVMMQYTDNILTRHGISKDTVSNLCKTSELENIDFIECSMSTGTTLAFFTNHNFDEGTKSCKLIANKQGSDYCIKGLQLEIEDSEKYHVKPLTEEKREKFQPQYVIGSSKIIDIRSPAIVSDFEFIPKIGLISFSVDRPQYVILYIPNEFVKPEMSVTINGQVLTELNIENNVFGIELTMIMFVPNSSGTVMITPLV